MKLSHGPNSISSNIIACTECEYQTLFPQSMKRHKRSKTLAGKKLLL